MKKTLLIQLFALLLAINFIACKKENPQPKTEATTDSTSKDHGTPFVMTGSPNHAPITGADSLIFTPLGASVVNLFCPNGDTNRCVIHDITSGCVNFYDGYVSSLVIIDSLQANHTYSIKGYNGSGTTNFTKAVSSLKNPNPITLPFRSYTQFFNNADLQGPNQGFAVIVMDDTQTPQGDHK